MKTVLDAFKEQQTKARIIQEKLLVFLAQGEAAGVPIDCTLKDKIIQSLVGNEKLKIALVGGFSEGKTSIAAAWLGRLKSDMNINHQESSNSVAIYDVDDNLTLIDTPGLFGYKEKFNADTGEQEKYKDITRKYVSESHLVLYVMNSTNPLKDSHAGELKWLFRDLNLLPRTVFVLSRFDEVSDIADEDDYQHNFAIKKQNVLSRLRDLIGIDENEERTLSVVAVSANPFDAGIEHWLSEPERFRQLSHISLLQMETTKKIELNGSLEKIALETSKSIIQDVLVREIPIAVERDEVLAVEISKLSKAVQRAGDDLLLAEKKIVRTQISLREFVVGHFSDLILQLQGASMETMPAFFEREIGEGGIVLDTKIQNAYGREIDSVCSDLVRIQSSLASEISAYDSHMMALGKQGVSWVLSSNLINASSIKAARDLLWSSFKFKPWGAVKLANGLNGVLSVVGVAFELWDSWQEAERVKQFEVSKKGLAENLNEQRRKLLEDLGANDFVSQFFPGFLALKNQSESLADELQKAIKQRQVFSKWRADAEIIEGDFSVLKNGSIQLQ